jgi:serine phosphatase RsbU (regulator of sigma subunit)
MVSVPKEPVVSSLHWTGAGLKPVAFELSGPSVLIGRREDCDLMLSFGYISGHHARLVLSDERWSIQDLGSTNGTMVNGSPAENTPLNNGDQISLGSLDMRFGKVAEVPHESPAATDLADEPSEESDAFATLAHLAPVAGTELEKLSLLLDLQVQWGDGFTADQTIHRILHSALTVSGAERGCILLKASGGFVYSAGQDMRGSALTEASFHASRSVVQKVVTQGKPVFMTQGLEGELAAEKSIVAMNLRAVGCMPLRRSDASSETLLGILYLDSKVSMHTLSGLDERILLKLAGEAASVLERMELLTVREERRVLERELELARQTQEGLLPKRIPELAGWALEAFCRPTRQVGGDFYDFIRLPDGRLAAMIADVSGKGVAASLVSSSVQGALQMLLREGRDLPEGLLRVNDYLCERSEEGRFVTLFVGLLASSGSLQWASAGHNPAYLFRRSTNEIDELCTTGVILGSLPSEEFGLSHEEKSDALEPGDLLVIYSDGLTEATGPDDELFGEERLLEIIRTHGRGGAAALRPRILDALEDFTRGEEQSDDITLVLAERLP